MGISLLERVPGFGRRLRPDELRDAAKRLTATSVELPAGPWKAPAEAPAGQLGYLVVDGVLLREVCIGNDWSSELLGEGDLLRPWLEDSASFVASRWQVLEEAELVVLDTATARQIARFPALVDELVERGLRRGRSMAAHAVIEGVHRIDERLLLLFWHIAEQHGQRLDGKTTVPIRLTHESLARLVGARRPTVTSALGDLQSAGLVERSPGGTWLLAGEPPTGADRMNGSNATTRPASSTGSRG